MQEETIKLNLIRQIMDLNDADQLKKISQAIRSIGLENHALQELARPIRNRLDIEELKAEQRFRPVDKKAFFGKIEKLDITESLDELLAMI
jgi:hypothetical protein